MNKKALLIFSLILSCNLFSNNISEFEKFKQSRMEMYQSYRKSLEEQFKEYKTNISKNWKEVKVPSKHEWIEYSDDYKDRTIVDYKNESIKIQMNVPKNQSDAVSQQQLINNMEKLMSQYVKNASSKNPYIEEGKTINSNESIVGDIYKVNTKNKEEIRKVSTEVVKKEEIKETVSKNTDEKVVEVTIPFPKDGLLSKAQVYRADVNKRAKEYKLDESLIFAVIHCESSYNPMATSKVPAYGLMQIVPTSAGKDISRRLYGKEKIFSPEYLYNGKNNIEAGANYLNLLYYGYLKDIKDPVSRKYCTIAAYNTGAGNVAKAFTGTTNINKAVVQINQMSSKEVYNRMIKKLPYQETRDYLKKVSEKDSYYKQKLMEFS